MIVTIGSDQEDQKGSQRNRFQGQEDCAQGDAGKERENQKEKRHLRNLIKGPTFVLLF